jgi:hypothetical protein
MSDVWDRITADLHAQLATNKRLLDGAWAQVAELTRDRDAAEARGRAKERADVVAWLADTTHDDLVAQYAIDDTRGEIERGEHVREDKPLECSREGGDDE